MIAHGVLAFVEFEAVMDARSVCRSLQPLCEQRAVAWMSEQFPRLADVALPTEPTADSSKRRRSRATETHLAAAAKSTSSSSSSSSSASRSAAALSVAVAASPPPFVASDAVWLRRQLVWARRLPRNRHRISSPPSGLTISERDIASKFNLKALDYADCPGMRCSFDDFWLMAVLSFLFEHHDRAAIGRSSARWEKQRRRAEASREAWIAASAEAKRRLHAAFAAEGLERVHYIANGQRSLRFRYLDLQF